MLRSIANISTNLTSAKHKQNTSTLGVVNDIILNVNDFKDLIPDIDVTSGTLPKSTNYIGAIRFSHIADGVIDEESFDIAFPYDRNFLRMPLKNEIVELIEVAGDLYYKLIFSHSTPSITADNTLLTALKNAKEFNEPSPDPVPSYSSSSKTGIPKNNPIKNKKDELFGEKFKGDEKVHRLELYEGDVLLESRFGQSIRFNGYEPSKFKKDLNPSILIRNNESALSKNEKLIGDVTAEDVNRDGTSIWITSGSRIVNFIPGTVDKNSNTDFKTKPRSFKNYPRELKGDQTIISSGRLIFSSRNAETIFYSKGNFGIISDNNISFDLGKGIFGEVKDNIDIITNDNNIFLNTGNGKIHLGDKSLEPIVLGDTLLDLMSQLIDAVLQQSFATPSGPSAIAPLNQTQFRNIKSKLKTMLSKQNKTS